MKNLKYQISHFFSELLFPSFCLGCQKEGVFLCHDCRSTLEISEYNYCLCSQKPLRLAHGSKNGKCYRCIDAKLSGLYFALPYKERALTKKLIYRFKYGHVRNLSKVLAGILTEHLVLSGNNSEKIWQNSILMPVPLEKRKLKERGYNQSEELAGALGQFLSVPSVLGNLVKIRETLSQAKLSAKDRQENLKNAFFVRKPDEVSKKKVFLVDDVYTTGSTMEECAMMLKEAGAKQVWGIAVAREE